MENRYNQRLFWYGFRAKVKGILGGLLFVFGIFLGMILGYVTKSSLLGWGTFFLMGGFGFYFILKSNAQRFDYQKQSGTIIHQGDW